mmetsp:Transcript_126340/g.404476  ORF Transcript_126340/g.404476 Transcript_126340/m.404476 type:complete len:106 (+) Transcript_126340:474-791(+)
MTTPWLYLQRVSHRCAVCLSDFDVGADNVVLPCRHTFHSSCVLRWLAEFKSTCPLCCAEVVIEPSIEDWSHDVPPEGKVNPLSPTTKPRSSMCRTDVVECKCMRV